MTMNNTVSQSEEKKTKKPMDITMDPISLIYNINLYFFGQC